MTGFAIAILKLGAWVTLVLGVSIAIGLSLASGAVAPAHGATPWYAMSDFARILLEVGSGFFGFVLWALLLTVAQMAEQVELLRAQGERDAARGR